MARCWFGSIDAKPRMLVRSPCLADLLSAFPLDIVKDDRLTAGVGDAVRGVRGRVHHRAGSDLRRLAIAEDFAVTTLNDHHLFFRMGVGSMGRLARQQHKPARDELG